MEYFYHQRVFKGAEPETAGYGDTHLILYQSSMKFLHKILQIPKPKMEEYYVNNYVHLKIS